MDATKPLSEIAKSRTPKKVLEDALIERIKEAVRKDLLKSALTMGVGIGHNRGPPILEPEPPARTHIQGAPPPTKLAYSLAEAVLVSGLSRPTLYRRINDGTLETVKIGGRRLVVAPALHKLLGA